MSRTAPRRLSAALSDLAGGLAPATTLAAVQEVWERAAGPAVAAAARPVAERDGALTVLCESAAWAQELDLMAADILERVNGELGSPAIAALRCRTG